MRPRARIALIGGAVLAAGAAAWLPALSQDAPQSILPPGFGAPPSPPPRQPATPSQAPLPAEVTPAPVVPPTPGADESIAVTNDVLPADDGDDADNGAEAEDVPEAAKRSPDLVGGAPVYGQTAFGDTDGRYLATLMRRLNTPIASRWAEIMLRRVLIGATPAPAGEPPADWVADRAALLLRLGESTAARQLVQGVDLENYTPRLRDIAMQAALATADPAGLCALPEGVEEINGQPEWPMIRAMCATLSGDTATANASIGRTPPGDPVDHALAEKLVAAGGGGRRRVTIDWTAVDALTDWRFGLASALGVLIPRSLLDAAPAWFEAWLAQAPMLAASDRVAPARLAAALGPLSGADLVDLYGRVMDESAADDVGGAAGRLRAAYRGDGDDERLTALHALWDAAANGGGGERDRYAASILTARAATGIGPAADQKDDVAPLLAAMFAGGFDRQAARWADVAEATGGEDGDRAWAMLAVGAERPVVAITTQRLQQLADRGGSAGRQRTAMLVAALAGLGRINPADAQRFADASGVALGVPSPYAAALRHAVEAHAPGAVALLVAAGMQDARLSAVPPADFYQMIGALHAAGLDGEARMIAAEAMTRL